MEQHMRILVLFKQLFREHSGSMLECLSWDRVTTGLSFNSITALYGLARHINPILVPVQPRKTHPYVTERLLMKRKESNQTKLSNYS